MLRNESSVMHIDQIGAIIAITNGNDPHAKEIRTGVYEIGHFGSSCFLPGYEQYPIDLSVGPYGVCDDAEQLLEACPELEAEGREFVITLTPVLKANQGPAGGWRWHKWGDYIGTQKPQCEYLYDEPNIDKVYCYHIYELKEE